MKLNNIETVNKVGQEVILKGWVNTVRKMGKIVFVDLRDRSGFVQVVLVPSEITNGNEIELSSIKPEYVLEITGIVNKRGEKQINKELPTGEVEVLAKSVKILNTAETPPFEIVNEERQANEELRLKYRYLDLRHERMQKNIKVRHAVIRVMREFFYDQDFLEIETPFLSKSTPEGARDFLVPSRNYPGKFYALPQSPQQYKQMLMVAGLEKYFQIVRCFRDEDQRGDRQAEFTQLDVEMSFVDQEEILHLVEKLIIEVMNRVKPAVGTQHVVSSQYIAPFPRMTYEAAMKKYKSDKPDLRKDKNNPDEFAFVWVTDFPMFEYKEGDKRWGATHHPFTAINPEDFKLLEKVKTHHNASLEKIRAWQYDLVLNGSEIAGGSIRTHDPKILHKVFEILGHSDKEIQAKFGHLLEAFKYGVPPHGGIAFGLDRLVAILCGETSIREVMAFPKTSDNRDPLMDSPSEVEKEQLEELGITIKNKM
ncbi:MAG: aspartate--tRNA ligase [Candidatus Komeilibacteria bacterium]|nr:aspartate--tRNA ligase [Candidatus Komeilibacteria bacterium]